METISTRVISVLPHVSFLSVIFVKFGELGGFTAIQTKLNTEEIEIAVRTIVFTSSYHLFPGIS